MGKIPNQMVPQRPVMNWAARKARVSFVHVKAGECFCLSECEKRDIKEIQDAFRQLCQMTWQQVWQSGGKPGTKKGLGYTQYEDTALKVRRPPDIPSDKKIAAFRATEKCRVFGYQTEDTFFILWFDRNHQIVKG